MHRLLMLSSAYQMSSAHPAQPSSGPDPLTVDPENRLLWRGNIQRLEAEQIRDSLFAVSGWLDPKMGGKTLPLRNKEFVFNHTSKDHTTYESPRRAVYLPIIRNHLYDMLEQFDYPDPTMPTGSRNATVVAPQALMMMNAPVVMDAAEKLASRLLSRGGDDTNRIEQAYALAYSRAPQPQETRNALAYLGTLQQALVARSTAMEASRKQAWSLFCQTLLAGNEFMYVR